MRKIYIKEEKRFGEKMKYKRRYKTIESKQMKRVVSNKKRDIHAIVRIEGRMEDFQKAVMEARKAAGKHNRFSGRKMSYDVELLEIF